jgi:hypothetical protein
VESRKHTLRGSPACAELFKSAGRLTEAARNADADVSIEKCSVWSGKLRNERCTRRSISTDWTSTSASVRYKFVQPRRNEKEQPFQAMTGNLAAPLYQHGATSHDTRVHTLTRDGGSTVQFAAAHITQRPNARFMQPQAS